MIKTVLVLGSGSAGLLAALALKTHFPSVDVCILRSPQIGTIGVGEGSTADMPNHLHGFLGIDPADFLAKARPTWKLGVRFLWGPREEFHYSFSHTATAAVPGLPNHAGHYAWEDFSRLDLSSALMAENKVFARQQDGTPFVPRNFAYHFENADFVNYLEQCALQRGVEIRDVNMTAAETGPEGIAALILDDGSRLSADLYVDASGFRSELLGRALGEPFVHYDDALLCDRALAGGWDREDEVIQPYTTAETMDSGWAWRIDHEQRINRGYVFSSAFISDDEAEAEFRRKNPRVTKTRLVKFTSGRYARSWVGNVIAVGNSAGFVEPLEATALFMISQSTRLLVAAMFDSGQAPQAASRAAYNRIVGKLWDEIRDFLAIHYRFNTRLDTPFWQGCRADIPLHGAQPVVDYYLENGPASALVLGVLPPDTSIFQLDGYYTLLLGQKVPHARLHNIDPADAAKLRAHQEHLGQIARNGYSVAEALALIRSPRWTWTPGFFSV